MEEGIIVVFLRRIWRALFGRKKKPDIGIHVKNSTVKGDVFGGNKKTKKIIKK